MRCKVCCVRVESYDINKNVEILKEAWNDAKDPEEPCRGYLYSPPACCLDKSSPKFSCASMTIHV